MFCLPKLGAIVVYYSPSISGSRQKKAGALSAQPSMRLKLGHNKLIEQLKRKKQSPRGSEQIFIIFGQDFAWGRMVHARCKTMIFIFLTMGWCFPDFFALRKRCKREEENLNFSKFQKSLKKIKYYRFYKGKCVWLWWWKLSRFFMHAYIRCTCEEEKNRDVLHMHAL